MFVSRKRKEKTAIEALHQQILASGEQTRAAVEAATARMEAVLVSERERGHRFQSAVQSAIEAIQHSAASNALDVSQAMTQIADMCGLIAERIESDRLERRELAEAERRERRELAEADRLERHGITEALAALSAPPARSLETPSHVLGGTIFGTGGSPDVDVSIVDDDAWGQTALTSPPARVRPRDDTCWIGGIEIADVKSENDKTKYWLRRRSDGYIFPQAFDAEDLRFDAETETDAAFLTVPGVPHAHNGVRSDYETPTRPG